MDVLKPLYLVSLLEICVEPLFLVLMLASGRDWYCDSEDASIAFDSPSVRLPLSFWLRDEARFKIALILRVVRRRRSRRKNSISQSNFQQWVVDTFCGQ